MTGEFSLLPALERSTLRTITLGALVICGGTLAALPFRRYESTPAPPSAPAHLTGPTESSLRPALGPPADGGPAGAAIPLDGAAALATTAPGADQAWPGTGQRFRPRQGVPLTYEDLEVPISLPPPIADRFNATAPIRALEAEQERLTDSRRLELVMPPAEALAQSQLAQIETAASEFVAEHREGPAVSGALVSARETRLDTLPKPAAGDRQRHWIRQPD